MTFSPSAGAQTLDPEADGPKTASSTNSDASREAADPSDRDPLAELHAELVELSRHLDNRLRRAATLRDRSRVPALEEESRRLHQHLTFLAEAAARTESPHLQRKVRQLERQLRNFELALIHPEVPERLLDPTVGIPTSLGLATRGAEGGPPANDACEAAPVIDFGTFFGDTTTATQDGQATCGASLASPDIWFELVPSQSGQVYVDTLGSGYDTVLSIHSGCPGTIANQLRCNDDGLGLASSLSFFASAGQSVWIRVSGYDGDTGALQLNLGQGSSVRGTVVDADTATPLSQGQVCLYQNYGFALVCSQLEPDGTYLLGEQDPGTYYAVASTDEHIDELFDDVRCPQGFDEPGCGPDDGTPLLLGSLGGLTADFALSQGGSLQGIVLDDATGLPIDFAPVRLRVLGSSSSILTQADASGVYRFSGLTAGTYEVYTATSTHQDELWDDIPCNGTGFNPECPVGNGLPVEVVEGATTSGIDFRLVRRSTITGQVTNSATGQPRSFAQIDLYHLEGNFHYNTSTNSGGVFTRSDLPAGTYHVAARDFGFASEIYDDIPCHGGCDLSTGTDIVVPVGGTVAGIDFALDALGTIHGQVVRALDGEPLYDGRVEVYDAFGFVDSDSLFTSGTYYVSRLPPGTYYVLATSGRFVDELYEDIPCEEGCDPATGTPVLVTSGDMTTVDFAVDIGGEIRGTVTDLVTGAPVAEAYLEVWDSSGQAIAFATSQFGDGTFRVDVPVGTYTLSASATGRYLDQLYEDLDCQGDIGPDCDPTLGTTLVTTGNTLLTDIDFALRRGAGISGRVTAAQSGSSLDYETVVLRLPDGIFVASSRTNSNGDYGIYGVEPGTYIASISPSFYFLAQLFDGVDCPGSYFACNLGLATPIVVPVDTVVGDIDFALQSKSSITGTVTHSDDGTAVFDADLRAYRASNLSFAEVDYSSFDGTYRLEDLVPGDYYILATDSDLAGEVFDDVPCSSISSCDLGQATRVTVNLGADTDGIDFALGRLGSVSGLVKDENGLPIAGVEVSAWTPGSNFSRTDYTDSAGAYRIDRLWAGPAYLATDNSWGYLDESYHDIPCFGGPFSGCDPLKGDPVTIAQGLETRHVDFELRVFTRGILGTVVDPSGEPVLGAVVDLWDASGNHVGSTTTAHNGSYYLNAPVGTHYVSTDNGQGLIDEVFDDLSCPGSAYAGGCDPTTGTPVVIGATGSDTAVASGIDFELRLPEPAFFADGFESGDLSAWSSAVGTLR